MEHLKVASLFCGCGGTDVGMLGGFTFLKRKYKKHPLKIVYANDIEDSACKIFETNFNIAPDKRDIRKVASSEIPDIDILTGGFPCQSFSIVAQNPKRLGVKDPKGMLFFEMCRILRDKKPKYFIAENVKGILSANRGEAFPLIIKEFEESGYTVSFKLLNAAQYGVPQKRERVIIVGVRRDLNFSYQFPKELSSLSNPISKLGDVLEPTVPEKYFFTEKAVEGMLKSKNRMNKGRIQSLDKPCNTVGAHLAKTSLNSTDPVFFINNRYRRFTPREVARIQSFPETFQLIGSEQSQYKALGNAIPPVMFWHVINELILQLEQNQSK